MTADYKKVSTFINGNLQKMIKMSTFAKRKRKKIFDMSTLQKERGKKYSICLLLENNNIKDHF